MKSLALIGAGGHGKVVAEIAELLGWKVTFFDDSFDVEASEANIKHEHWDVKGTVQDLFFLQNQFSSAFVAIGDNKLRKEFNLRLEKEGFSLPTLIHPTAVVSQYSEVAAATVIMANVTINPCVEIGEGVILNTNAIIEHDCKIAEYAHISPGATLAGNVKVGSCSWIGLNSSIIQGLAIGANVTVGAGSTVINDVPENTTVVGSPARTIKK